MHDIKNMKNGYEKTKIYLALNNKLQKEQARVKWQGLVCKNCATEIPYEKRQSIFCSRSCAAKFNNSNRKKIKKCKGCEAVVQNKSVYCINCKPVSRKVSFLSNQTKEMLFSSRKNWQSARSTIRSRAVTVFKKASIPLTCKICNYDKHIEICHIKPVSAFHGSTTINEINALSNLIALCPNHHWEFDNNLLKLANTAVKV